MGTTNILDLNNRVDELEKSYPASQVMMTDGVTSVEEAVDEVTEKITIPESIQAITSSVIASGTITIKKISGINFVLINNIKMVNAIPAGEELEISSSGSLINPPSVNTIILLRASAGGKDIYPVYLMLYTNGRITIINLSDVSTLVYGIGCGAYI